MAKPFFIIPRWCLLIRKTIRFAQFYKTPICDWQPHLTCTSSAATYFMGKDCQAGSETEWDMQVGDVSENYSKYDVPKNYIILFRGKVMINHDSCSLHSLFSDKTVAPSVGQWVHRMTNRACSALKELGPPVSATDFETCGMQRLFQTVILWEYGYPCCSCSPLVSAE